MKFTAKKILASVLLSCSLLAPLAIPAHAQQSQVSDAILLLREKKIVTATDERTLIRLMRTHILTSREIHSVYGVAPEYLTILRNTPYAAQGYVFLRKDLRDIFAATSWYHATEKSVNVVERKLTRTERANIAAILRYEKSHK